MVADMDTLHKDLLTRVKIYKRNHFGKTPTIHGMAKLLSNTLYSRRTAPYYAFNLLCGIEEETGRGIVFGYDAIGSFDTIMYGMQGSGQQLGIPLLDNQL